MKGTLRYTAEMDTELMGEMMRRAQQQHVEFLGRALVSLAEATMDYAKEVTVPVKTGYLRSTGWVDPKPLMTSTSLEVRLGFDADYALEQEQAGRPVGANKARPEAGRRYMRRALLYVMADAEERINRLAMFEFSKGQMF